MGMKVGIPIKKLWLGHSSKSGGKGKESRTVSMRSFVYEAFEDENGKRHSKSNTLVPERTPRNVYANGRLRGKQASLQSEDIANWYEEFAAAYSESERAAGRKKLRKDAVIGYSAIIKPPAEEINKMSPADQTKFTIDSIKVFNSIVKEHTGGCETNACFALHLDEAGMHSHMFGVPLMAVKDSSGKKIREKVCAHDFFHPRLYRMFNKEFPERMRQLGWDVEDCVVYDPDAPDKDAEKERVRKIKSEKPNNMSVNEYQMYMREAQLNRRETDLHALMDRVEEVERQQAEYNESLEKREQELSKKSRELDKKEKSVNEESEKATQNLENANKKLSEANEKLKQARLLESSLNALKTSLDEREEKLNARDTKVDTDWNLLVEADKDFQARKQRYDEELSERVEEEVKKRMEKRATLDGRANRMQERIEENAEKSKPTRGLPYGGQFA